eukprot:SAG22_NODE_16911_length_315_cov_0.578704_1_plen_60_part_01
MHACSAHSGATLDTAYTFLHRASFRIREDNVVSLKWMVKQTVSITKRVEVGRGAPGILEL